MKNNQSRQARRQARMTVKGKEIKIMKFIAARAKDLPPMNDKANGAAINHESNMKKVYLEHGVEGVNAYVRRVRAVTLRDMGNTWFTRLAGWAMLKWYRLNNK